MKLFVVGCLLELRQDVMTLLQKAQLNVFSVSETTGFRSGDGNYLADDWFGQGDSRFDSLIFFSFTDAKSAETAMQLVRNYNEGPENKFPLKAFIIPVESSNQIL